MNYVKTIVIFLITLITACTFTRNTSGSFTDSNGDTVIYASKIIPLPDGGTEYDFNIDGRLDTTRIPPEGFNFSTATDKQLEFYHIPHDKDRVAGLPRNDPRLKIARLKGDSMIVMMSHTNFWHPFPGPVPKKNSSSTG